MIYVNTLGGFEPEAGISHFGGSYGQGGYLSFHSTASNNPDNNMHWDNTPESIATIARWAETHGYDIVEGKDSYGAYKAQLTHRETIAAAKAAKELDAQTFESAETGYLRYGHLPEGGFSKNAATGGYESGVSVFRAEFAADGKYRPLLQTNQQLGSYLSLLADNRPVYRVYGEGGDGEPVLKVERIVKI